MHLCGNGKAKTPLERYSTLLSQQSQTFEEDAPPLFFPMYTLPVRTLLDMGDIEPHEVLKEMGALVEFHESIGKAAFVSHQWVGASHPDPEFKQLRVLQDAITHMMEVADYISVDIFTETLVRGAKAFPTEKIRAHPLFIWYDYFSCPQLDLTARRRLQLQGGGSSAHTTDLAKAIDSIPAYIGRASFFFALCPVVESLSQSKVFSVASWADRGWCRMERACRQLSVDATWIIIKSRTEQELVATQAASHGGSAGEGAFTVPEDRAKLAPVLVQALKRRLMLYLQKQDLLGYRALLNLQSVHLSGFPVEPVQNLVPGFEGTEDMDPASLVVARFLFQNGFESVRDVDKQGLAPLHYAALSGDPKLLRSLLDQRAEIDLVTKRDLPLAGVPPWASALAISIMFKHDTAARLLIEAKAKLGGGIQPAVNLACQVNNVEGLRILCKAGASPHSKDMFGFTAFQAACGQASMECIEELVNLSEGNLRVSSGLCCAMAARGGKAELVHRLLELRADVNYQITRDTYFIHGVFLAAKSFQHVYGRQTIASKAAYHHHGQTALMAAVMTGQYEGAAALIAAGARLDLRNARGMTVHDFAREQTVPTFLQEALQGDQESARKISADAVSFFSI